MRARALALLLATMFMGLPPAAQAQDGPASATCTTGDGERPLLELADDVAADGYSGPWDPDSIVAAYVSASGDPIDCVLSAADRGRPLAIVLIGGYGTTLSSATDEFSALRAAIAERSPSAFVVQYSYKGVRFAGCSAAPLPYDVPDTAQELEASESTLRDIVGTLQDACHVDRVAILGHSLGGLIAFSGLDTSSVPDGSRLILVDSPLGGLPEKLVQTCVALSFCPDGAVADQLAGLYLESPSAENASRAGQLAQAGIGVSAWGNTNDCFYDVVLCAPIARTVVGADDARESQWLGIPSVVRKSYPVTKTFAGIGTSHTTILEAAAAELAADLAP